MIVIRLLILGYILAIVGVIIMSWFPMGPDGPGYRAFVFLRRITDPVLEPLRRVIPPVGGMLDLSPTIALLVLFVVLRLLP